MCVACDASGEGTCGTDGDGWVSHDVVCAAHGACGKHVSCVALSGSVFGKCVAGVADGGSAGVACVLFAVPIEQDVYVVCDVHEGCAACVARGTCVAHVAVVSKGEVTRGVRSVCVACDASGEGTCGAGDDG